MNVLRGREELDLVDGSDDRLGDGCRDGGDSKVLGKRAVVALINLGRRASCWHIFIYSIKITR